MSLAVLSNYDLLNLIVAYCDQMTICELLCVSKEISVQDMMISSIEVKGIHMYDFAKWLKKNQITKIKNMTISEYNLSNDHCMDYYKENCRCREEIISLLNSLQVTNLTLNQVNLSGFKKIEWNEKTIQGIWLVNYTHDDEEEEWINRFQELKDLHIAHEYSEYQPSYLPSHKFLLSGIKNPKLESFSTNIFYFVEDLKLLLQNSKKNENLKQFSFETLFDDELVDVVGLIKKKFPFSNIIINEV